MYSFSSSSGLGLTGSLGSRRSASSQIDRCRRYHVQPRYPVRAAASSGAFTTTLHKDGSVTYHFTSDLLEQTAVSPPVDETEAITPESSDKERPPAEAQSMYEEMHARVSAVVADLDTALLTLDKDGYGSELNVDVLRTAATLPASDDSSNGEQRAEYVPEEDLGPLMGADGIQIPRAALLKIRESQTQHKIGSSKLESDVAEVQSQSESESAAEVKRAGQQHVRTGPAQLRDLMQPGNMQRADALHVLQLFSGLCSRGELGNALKILEAAVKARREDVVCRVRHKHFLRAAADLARGSDRQHATKLAMRFVQVLPRQYTDARTYNMLISVCVKAKDLTQALHAADMLKSTGRKLDTILYTNLIGVCAAVGNADKAFQLYASMKVEGVKSDPQVYTVLISACSREILGAPASNRRLQLVLLERAQGVLAEMRAVHLMPDAHLWNALIAAAGRAGQLQRAFQNLDDMQGAGCHADAHTYASVIDACARACRCDLAVQAYKKALQDGYRGCVIIYTSVIAACGAMRPVELSTALSVYEDMQRNGVQPDMMFYAVLIEVVGAAGDLETAFKIFAKAEALIPQRQVLQSALIQACIECGDLGRARKLYAGMRAAGQVPTLKAFNSLINAYGRAMRLGDTVSLVKDLVGAGIRPDMRTFAAVLGACQRANEPELAFEVYRIMKQQGHVVDEVVCFILLRLCFNCLRASWIPGGYPPKKDASKAHTALAHSAAGPSLLHALGDSVNAATRERLGGACEASWQQRAVDVYREALSASYTPRAHIIERVLACLRLPATPPSALPAALPLPFKAGGLVAAEEGNRAEALLQSNSRDAAKIFDFRAVSILEEAVSLGALPQFSLHSSAPLDLRGIPPSTAEVYILAIVAQMQRGAEPKANQDLTILVPSYDPAHIFRLSYEPEQLTELEMEFDWPSTAEAEGAKEAVDEKVVQKATAAEGQAGTKTGLGVAGMLRRIGLWAKEDAARGRITINDRELLRWKRAADRAAQHARNATSMLQEDQWFGPSIARQQSNIRMGLGQLAGSNRKPEPTRQNGSDSAHRKAPSQAMPPVWSQP